MMDEWWIGKRLEGKYRCLIEVLSWHLPWGTGENSETFSHNRRCHCRDLTWDLPEYESKALQLHYPTRPITSRAAPRQAGYMAHLNTSLCQWRQLWRKMSRATHRLVEPKTCTVFYLLNTCVLGSNPTRDIDIISHIFCVYIVPCRWWLWVEQILVQEGLQTSKRFTFPYVNSELERTRETNP
jgi:hypothetical protein